MNGEKCGDFLIPQRVIKFYKCQFIFEFSHTWNI